MKRRRIDNNDDLFLDGTAARFSTPPYSFDNDPNTGLARTAQDEVSLVVNGQKALIAGTGGITFPLGTSGASSIIDDTAAEAFLVRKLGDTGDVFTVNTTSSIVTADADVVIDNTSSEAFLIRKNGDSGDVFLVNTTSPSATIGNTTTAGNLSLVAPTSGSSNIYFNDGTNAGIVSYDHSTNTMGFSTNTSSKITINSTGDLIFGTNSRGLISNSYVGEFILNQGASNQALILRKVNPLGGIKFSGDNGSTYYATFSEETAGGANNGTIIFDLDGTEALNVRKDGDAGDILVVDTVNNVVRLGNTTNGCDLYLYSSNTGTSNIYFNDGASSGQISYNHNSNVMTFGPSGVLSCSTSSLNLPNGSESTPAFIFGSGTSGMYKINTGNLGLSLLGTLNVDYSTARSKFSSPIEFATYTVGTLPTATAARMIYVSDESGGPTLAMSDGTNWRRVYDYAIVS